MKESTSSRISIAEQDNQLTITILPRVTYQTWLMIAWLVIWTGAGAWMMIAVLNSISVFLLIAVALWGFGIYLVIKHILWDLWGIQSIQVKGDSLTLKETLLGKDKQKTFQLEHLRDLKIAQTEDELLATYGDKPIEPDELFDNGILQFVYQNNLVNFVCNVGEADAQLILSHLKSYLEA